MIFPEDVTDEEFAQIRALVDKLQPILEEAKVPREIVTAAFGVLIGEQLREASDTGLAILNVQNWAIFTFEHAEEVA